MRLLFFILGYIIISFEKYVNLLKVGIKLLKVLKVSYVRILFLVFLLFVAVINPYSVFKILKYSSLFTFIVPYMYL